MNTMPSSPCRTKSAELNVRARAVIPGGTVSMNRKVDPEIAFVRGKGAHLWDADGNRYLDFHAAFGPYLLGHNDDGVESAVRRAQEQELTLTGTGTTPWEVEAAEWLSRCVPNLEKVQFVNTGSEATFLALRLARAFTGREHVCVMQGGYNGWHDEVACNVMTPLAQVGPERRAGEYPYVPMSAGIPAVTADRVHVLQFNSLEAVEWAFQTYPVAALITEPILQNIGVVKPLPGYLAGIRDLCDRYGVILIFDEVKTGFRHALGGYQSIAGVKPDLSVFGKAIANGYPVGALGGRADLMDLFDSPDPAKRVMIAGTYNGHPIPIAACIATMKFLFENPEIYEDLEAMGARIERGIREVIGSAGIVARQGSALCPYFMDHAPTSWHDLATHHNTELDLELRKALIARGIYVFPLATKQWSISAAHTDDDLESTLDAIADAWAECAR